MHTEKTNNAKTVPSTDKDVHGQTPEAGSGVFGIHALPFPLIEAIKALGAKDNILMEYFFLRLGHQDNRRYSRNEAAKKLNFNAAECEKMENTGIDKISRIVPNAMMRRVELTLEAPTRTSSSQKSMPPGPSRPVITLPASKPRPQPQPRTQPLPEPVPNRVSPLAHSVPSAANDGEPAPERPSSPLHSELSALDDRKPNPAQAVTPSKEPVSTDLLDAIERIVNDAVAKHCAKPDDQPMFQMLEALAKSVTEMKGILEELAENVRSAPVPVESEPKAPVNDAPIEEPKAETPDGLVDALNGIKTALTKQADGFNEFSQLLRRSLESSEKSVNTPIPATAPSEAQPAAQARPTKKKAKPKRRKARKVVNAPPKASAPPPPPEPPPQPVRHQVDDNGTVKVGRKVYVTADEIGKTFQDIKPWRIRDLLTRNVLGTILGLSRRGRESTLYPLVESRRTLEQYRKSLVV